MSDFDLIETEEAVRVNNLQIYQQDKAAIDMQIATAKAYPRNLKRCIENAVTIATLDKETAESCTYAISKGGKTIKGPSVNLAKIVAQSLGNMRIENRVVGFDKTHVTCEAICFDLETNFAIRTQIKKSIVGNSGTYSEDMKVITGNAGNSIALRNAIFAVVPKNIINKVYEAAKQVITGDVSTETKLVALRTTVFNGLKEVYHDKKLTDEEICKSVGKEAISNINKDDLVVLIGYQNALKEGEQQFETVFRPQAQRTRPEPPKSEDKESERLLELIRKAPTEKILLTYFDKMTTNDQRLAYDEQMKKVKS